jgi:hypothetical protein
MMMMKKRMNRQNQKRKLLLPLASMYMTGLMFLSLLFLQWRLVGVLHLSMSTHCYPLLDQDLPNVAHRIHVQMHSLSCPCFCYSGRRWCASNSLMLPMHTRTTQTRATGRNSVCRSSMRSLVSSCTSVL